MGGETPLRSECRHGGTSDLRPILTRDLSDVDTDTVRTGIGTPSVPINP